MIFDEEERKYISILTYTTGGHTKAASYRTYSTHASKHGTVEAIRIAHLQDANIVATHAFAKLHSIPCESRPCETVDIIYDAATFAEGIRVIKQMQSDMEPGDRSALYKVYDADTAKELFLTPGDDVEGAVSYPAGSINAYKFAVGVLKLCLDRGLNLQTNTPVTAIDPISSVADTDGVNGHASGPSPRWTVTTPRGTISTPNLILATNGYSAHLLPSLIGSIVPYRGQVIASASSATLSNTVPNGLPTTYSFIYANGYEYMIPRPHHSTSPDVPAE